MSESTDTSNSSSTSTSYEYHSQGQKDAQGAGKKGQGLMDEGTQEVQDNPDDFGHQLGGMKKIYDARAFLEAVTESISLRGNIDKHTIDQITNQA